MTQRWTRSARPYFNRYTEIIPAPRPGILPAANDESMNLQSVLSLTYSAATALSDALFIRRPDLRSML